MRSGAAALAVALAVLFLLSSGLAARGSTDLLIDDGFENGVGDWVASGGTLDTVCGDRGYESDCSAVLTPDNPGSVRVQRRTAVAIRPSADYTLSASVLKNDPQVYSVELQLCWSDQAGNPLSPCPAGSAPLRDNAADWQPLSATRTAPENAAFARPRISVNFYGSGTVYFDDVTLEGPPPDDTPAPTDTPAVPLQPSATAIATVAPTVTQTRVPTTTPSTVPSATPTTGPGSALVNGGFEDADGDGPLGWNKYGGELQQSSAHARSGQYSGAFSSSTTATKWVYQTVRVSGGSAYDFSGYVLLDDPGVSESYLRISWYASDDCSGSALATSDSTTHLGDVDPTFRFLTTGAALAPADARSARLRVMLAPASEAPATIYIDDVSFEPASLDAVTPSPPATSVVEPQSDIGTAAIIQRVTKPRATVAGQSVVRQATPPIGKSSASAIASVRNQGGGGIETAAAPVPTSDDTRLRILISLASGAVALLIGGSSGLFLARLNGRRL